MLWDAREHEGLIFAETVHDARELEALQRSVRRGSAIRIRRGVYCSTATWAELSDRDRHVLRVRATWAQSRSEGVIAGLSAGALWGFPIEGAWPPEVTVLGPLRSGGKSEPGVRRTSAGAEGAGTTVHRGFPVTTVARTALDIARGEDLPIAAATLDWALSLRNDVRTSRDDLRRELARARFRTGAAGLARAVEFASEQSGSFGESRARGVIELLGFASPVLQRCFVDRDGAMYVDFFWPDVSVVAEFDGKWKYTRGEFTQGEPPAEIVWKEKKREDRLRRLVRRVERITTADVATPRRLAAILTNAGVPRR